MPIGAEQWRVRVGLSYGRACREQRNKARGDSRGHQKQRRLSSLPFQLALCLAVVPLLLVTTGYTKRNPGVPKNQGTQQRLSSCIDTLDCSLDILVTQW